MTLRILVTALALAASPLALAVAPLPPPKPLAAPPANAVETASGMSYVVLKPGADASKMASGPFVEFTADVWSADGVTRANAKESGPQLALVQRLAREQPGLARAILTSPVGETRRWWFQADRLKPGYAGMPDLPHVVDLTVLGTKDPLQTPADLAAPPADALRTPSGIVYRVLKRGPGGPKPTLSSTVEIHYSGWTSYGRLFDSSVQRDVRAVFPLDQLILGWQEGVPLMSRGDTFRFWIPGALGYDLAPASPNAPRGTLVFDITLYDFHEPR
jgi:peptidylprolyl isomerase